MMFPKNKPKRSLAVRNSARGERCALMLDCCNGDPETTIYAHLRFFNHGGVSTKPHDLLGVYACSACHDALDGRTRVNWEWDAVLRALMSTLVSLSHKGIIKMRGEK